MEDRMIVDIKWLQGKIIQNPDQHGLIAENLDIQKTLEGICQALIEEDEDLQTIGGSA
jgi:hypothetical protein